MIKREDKTAYIKAQVYKNNWLIEVGLLTFECIHYLFGIGLNFI